MHRLKTTLYRASRSRSFLWKFALSVTLAGTGVGVALSFFQPSGSHLFGERVLARVGISVKRQEEKLKAPKETPDGLLEALRAELATANVSYLEFVWAIESFAPHVAPADYPAFQTVLRPRFTEEEATLATNYLGAWLDRNSEEFSQLKAQATIPEPLRYARYLLGRIDFKQKNYLAGFEYAFAEAQHPGAYESRHLAVLALAESHDFKKLDSLRQDKRFAPYFTPRVALAAATGARDWRAMMEGIVALQLASYDDVVVLIAIVSALGWGFFLVHFGQVRSPGSGYFWLCVLGLIAGIVSTIPTIFCVIVQDDIFHFAPGEDPVRIFAYFIAGVGAREELCKLLLFLPLLPFLLRGRNEFEALTVACFVGLGFAVEENVGYFGMSAAANAPGRFLTANFFHVALTGMNGLALFRACTRGVAGLNEFLTILPITILAHGAYDALIELSTLDETGFIAMALFIGFCYLFFDRAHAIRPNAQMTISLTGALIFGVSLLAATVSAFQIATLGVRAGGPLIFGELLGSAILLIMFFREFNEPLGA